MPDAGRSTKRRRSSNRSWRTPLNASPRDLSPRRSSPRLNASPEDSARRPSSPRLDASPRQSRSRGLSPASPRESQRISPRGISGSRPSSPLSNVANSASAAAPAPELQKTYQPPIRVNKTQVQKSQKSFSDFSQLVDRLVSDRGRKNIRLEDRYQYIRFSSPSQIRLLAINPAKNTSDPIYCRLVVYPFKPDQPIVYEALSYMWGTDVADKEIKIARPTFSRLNPWKERPNRKLHYDVHIAKFWARFYIRSNLRAALQHLRDAKNTVWLWVDALCIDQDNKEERNVQVRKMAEIYSRATNVCVWLGVGNLQSQLALDFIPILLQDTNAYLNGEDKYGPWCALAELMRNQWFSRRWVIQEVALAKEASLHCGNKSLHWADFADAVMIFVWNFDKINALTRDAESANTSQPLGNVRTGAYALVKVINNYLRKSADGFERLATLEVLVSILFSFEAAEPRDTIYAVLSLARDTIESNPSLQLDEDVSPIEPDYNKSIIEVFKEFIDFAIRTSESLDIICRHWAPVPKKKDPKASLEESPFPRVKRRRTDFTLRDEYPSWIPSVSGSPYGTPMEALTGRKHGDNFVGTSDRRTYNATPRTRPIWRFMKISDHLTADDSGVPSPFNVNEASNSLRIIVEQPSGRHNEPPTSYTWDNHAIVTKPWWSMHVTGFRLDVIKHPGSRVARGVIPRECLELTGWQWPEHHDDVDIPEIPDEIWRTMVADRGPDGDNPPIFYQRACQKCLAQSIHGDIEIMKLMETIKDVMVIDFLKRVEKVTWNRKFLRSEGRAYSRRGNLEPKKLFGLAPPRAEKDDIICILLGCSVPVILREHHRPVHYFEFIGEAYIYGMMSGEALGGRRMDRLLEECEEFELR